MSIINFVKIIGGSDYRIDSKADRLSERAAYKLGKKADKDNDGSITVNECQDRLFESHFISTQKLDDSFFLRGIDRVANGSSISSVMLGIDDIATNGDSRGIPLLVKLLDDPRPQVRTAAAEAVGEIAKREKGRPKLNEAVSRLLDLARRDQDTDVRRAALKALGNIGGDGIFEFIKSVLLDQNENEDVRASAANALADADGAKALPILQKVAAEGTNVWVQMNAEQAAKDIVVSTSH